MAQKSQPCTAKRYEIDSSQLPLCCPLPDNRIWDAHPRVYLPIEAEGQIICPYCSAQYRLTDWPVAG